MRDVTLAACVALLLLANPLAASAASLQADQTSPEPAATVVCPPATSGAIGQQAQTGAGFCECADLAGSGACTVTQGQCNAGFTATCSGGGGQACGCICTQAQ